MNLVLDEAEEVSVKRQTRKTIGALNRLDLLTLELFTRSHVVAVGKIAMLVVRQPRTTQRGCVVPRLCAPCAAHCRHAPLCYVQQLLRRSF